MGTVPISVLGDFGGGGVFPGDPRWISSPPMEAAVFLDRDNTLIANDGDLGEPDRVRLMGGVARGLKALREAGYRLVVVTNQGGVARGRYSEDDVDAVHQRIARLVDTQAEDRDLITRFYYCPYHPEAELDDYRRDHPWRKPHPGMLLQAARDMTLDLTQCWMVGDQERDVVAGRSAGCRTVLLSADEGLITSAHPTAAAGDFSEAVQTILRATPSGLATNGVTPPPPRTEGSGREASPPPPTPGSAPGPTPGPTPGPAPGSAKAITAAEDLRGLRHAIEELRDEMRSSQLRRAEFTAFRLAAGMCQLLAMTLAVLGLLQLGTTDVFLKWMIGAVLAQLVTIAILLLDAKG